MERVVLVGGHESDDGADLVRFARHVTNAVVAMPGRALHDTVLDARSDGATVLVVPMTFGRDPSMVADTARSLRWLRRSGSGRSGDGALALTAPFGDATHLTALLRTKADVVRRTDPGAALLIVARSSDPLDDAELHRVAHLVRVHGAGLEVAVAAVDSDAALAPVLARLRLLGVERAAAVSASFAAHAAVDPTTVPLVGTIDHGPLISDSAVVTILAQRVQAARHALAHGDDGIESGLAAEHEHGHTHTGEHSHDHDQESFAPAVPSTG